METYKHRSDKKNIMNKIELLLLFYFVSLNLRYLTNINFYFTSLIWGVIGVFTFGYIYNYFVNMRSILNKIILLDFFALIGMIINGNHNLANIIILFSAEIFGVILYLTKNNLKKIDIFVELTLLFLLVRILLAMYERQSLFFEKYQFSKIMGTNTLSIFVILLFFVDILYIQEIKKKPRYYMYIVALCLSVFTNGNGNILSFFLLLLGFTFINSEGNRILWDRILIIGIVGVIILIGSGHISYVINFLTDDHDRFWIWTRYFGHAFDNIWNIVFGIDISSDEDLLLFGHMHNTFINWHFYYGLLPMIGFTVIIIKSIISTIQNKYFFCMIFLFITIIRGFTDETTFLFMPIWIYCMCVREINNDVFFDDILLYDEKDVSVMGKEMHS